MATPFHLPLTAAQVGTYFAGQYYQVLQQQPEFVHQFYSDVSTMLRFDGNTRETASGMLQIHALVMSLNYAGIEIKTAHSLESWNGGVIVMISGSVHIKDFNGMRKFVQTIFLAPQEKGYFVLNDIFHFIEESIHQHPVAYLAQTQTNLDSKLNASIAIREPVSNYILNGDIQARKFVAPANIEENGSVDNFSYPEQRLQQVPETQNVVEENFAVQSTGSLQSTLSTVQEHLSPMNPVQERVSTPIKEPVEEPQKHTYASILQVAKGKSAPSITSQLSSDNTTPPASEWHQIPEPPAEHYGPPPISITVERSGAEAVEEASVVEDEVDSKKKCPKEKDIKLEELKLLWAIHQRVGEEHPRSASYLLNYKSSVTSFVAWPTAAISSTPVDLEEELIPTSSAEESAEVEKDFGTSSSFESLDISAIPTSPL